MKGRSKMTGFMEVSQNEMYAIDGGGWWSNFFHDNAVQIGAIAGAGIGFAVGGGTPLSGATMMMGAIAGALAGGFIEQAL